MELEGETMGAFLLLVGLLLCFGPSGILIWLFLLPFCGRDDD